MSVWPFWRGSLSIRPSNAVREPPTYQDPSLRTCSDQVSGDRETDRRPSGVNCNRVSMTLPLAKGSRYAATMSTWPMSRHRNRSSIADLRSGESSADTANLRPSSSERMPLLRLVIGHHHFSAQTLGKDAAGSKISASAGVGAAWLCEPFAGSSARAKGAGECHEFFVRVLAKDVVVLHSVAECIGLAGITGSTSPEHTCQARCSALFDRRRQGLSVGWPLLPSCCFLFRSLVSPSPAAWSGECRSANGCFELGAQRWPIPSTGLGAMREEFISVNAALLAVTP